MIFIVIDWIWWINKYVILSFVFILFRWWNNWISLSENLRVKRAKRENVIITNLFVKTNEEYWLKTTRSETDTHQINNKLFANNERKKNHHKSFYFRLSLHFEIYSNADKKKLFCFDDDWVRKRQILMHANKILRHFSSSMWRISKISLIAKRMWWKQQQKNML